MVLHVDLETNGSTRHNAHVVVSTRIDEYRRIFIFWMRDWTPGITVLSRHLAVRTTPFATFELPKTATATTVRTTTATPALWTGTSPNDY